MASPRSSSSSSQASDVTITLTAAPVVSTLKPPVDPTTNYGPNYSYDSCTYYKKNPVIDDYSKGCYLFRSCQSCLEIEGCMVNDFGVCVEARRGFYNIQRIQFENTYGYNQDMNYIKAVNQSLALPAAVSSNAAALSKEQNWHFRAGEASYCSATDPVCQECKQKNFWRGNDTSELPDSRFCVGQSGCVCIQTCEVRTFVDPGCQWVLSQASSSSDYYSNSHSLTVKAAITGWEWAVIVILILVVSPFILRCCHTPRDTRKETARKEAVRVVRRELGVPDNETSTGNASSARSTASPAVV